MLLRVRLPSGGTLKLRVEASMSYRAALDQVAAEGVVYNGTVAQQVMPLLNEVAQTHAERTESTGLACRA